MFAAPHEDSTSRTFRRLDVQAKTIIANVRLFFEELERRLGDDCAGTIFKAPTKLTALACRVSFSEVRKIMVSAERIPQPIPRMTRTVQKTRKYHRIEALRKYGGEWGSIVRHLIHDKFKEEVNVTLTELWTEMKDRHPTFGLCRTSFYYLLRGLGFTYRINDGQRCIFEKPEIRGRRARYLDRVEEARRQNHCIVYIDETWIFDCMTRKRGWNDTTIPRFAPASTLQEYSCGLTASKTRGRRAIVIGAITREGVVPGCTRIIISGRGLVEDDVHRDMNHSIFEEWLTESIPCMLDFAAGRSVSIVMDNASYHSRQVEKIPTRSSTKAVIEDYLRQKGIVVPINCSKADLLVELQHFIASRGGMAAVRSYAVENICAQFGVAVIRLPPYHCFFNPIELCWSQLKGNLAKYGHPTESLHTVRIKALDYMENVSRRLCEAWTAHAIGEEDAAREKILVDLAIIEDNGNNVSDHLSSSDEDLPLDDVLSTNSDLDLELDV